MKEKKTYSASDIERYHNGQLSSAEMHVIEKAAMDDPFLADALEGYAFTKTPATDKQKLQQRLTERIAEKKDKKIFSIGNNWLKIAALFILIAGGAWLVFNGISSSSKNSVVANVEKQIAPTQSSTYKMSDSITTVQPSPKDNTVVFQSRKESKQMTPNAPPATNQITVSTTDIKDEAKQEAAANRKAEDKNLSLLSRMEALKTDSLANGFAKKEKERAAIRSVTANDTIKNFDVVLKSTEVAPDEVVVLHKNKSRSNAQFKKVVIDTLEPAQGWSNFDDYIAGNIKSPDELKMKPVNGEVELSFEVNKEGEPVNITITKSLCEKCDEEAVRLLKEGPKWNKKKKTGKVKIKF